MSASELWEVASAVLASIGSAGIIILGLSSYLGKIWADRLMTRERAAHERDLAELRNRLDHQTQEKIAAWETDLSIFKDKHLRGFHDKLAVYRLVIDLVSEMLGDYDEARLTGQPFPMERRVELNRLRLKVYGNLALLAPQSVMDAQDSLMGYLLLIAAGKETYDWARVRELALNLLNEVRKDVGIDTSPIEYHGNS